MGLPVSHAWCAREEEVGEEQGRENVDSIFRGVEARHPNDGKWVLL